MPATAVDSFDLNILTLLKYDRTARPVPRVSTYPSAIATFRACRANAWLKRGFTCGFAAFLRKGLAFPVSVILNIPRLRLRNGALFKYNPKGAVAGEPGAIL